MNDPIKVNVSFFKAIANAASESGHNGKVVASHAERLQGRLLAETVLIYATHETHRWYCP